MCAFSGPSKVVFLSGNESTTNVTDLTKGKYIIQLTVVDGNGNKANDRVEVTVTQSEYLFVVLFLDCT